MSTETLRPTGADNSVAYFPREGGGVFPRGRQYYKPGDPPGGENTFGYAHGDSVEDLVGIAGTINSVRVDAVGTVFTGPDNSATVFSGIKVGGSLYQAATQDVYSDVGSPWTNPISFSHTYYLNPKTGAAWTPAEVAALGWYAGVVNVAQDGCGARVSDLSYVIDYVALTPPAAPSGLSGTSTPGAHSTTLTWSDNSSNEALFKIERCSGAGCSGFVEIATVGPGVTTYLDSGLDLNTTYRYRVRASNAAGNSSYTNTAEVLNAAGPVEFLAPSMVGTGAFFGTFQFPNVSINATSMVGWGVMGVPPNLPGPAQNREVGHGVLGFRDDLRPYVDLADDKSAKRRAALEMELGYVLPAGIWTLHQLPAIYKQNVALTYADLVRDVRGVETGSSPPDLVRVESLALCIATAGSYYYDRATYDLYVHMSDNTSPALKTMTALLGFYFSGGGEYHPALGPDPVVDGEFESFVE